MSNTVFTADIAEFQRLTLDKMRLVARRSIEDTINLAQTPVAQGGDMPVDTGTLRGSLVSLIVGGLSSQGADSHLVTIAQLEIGNIARFEWSADYAVPRHYMIGVGQGGGLWRDKAVQRWQAIVRENVSKVQ